MMDEKTGAAMTIGMDAAERIANWALDNLSKEAIERLVFMLDDGVDYLDAIHSARKRLNNRTL